MGTHQEDELWLLDEGESDGEAPLLPPRHAGQELVADLGVCAALEAHLLHEVVNDAASGCGVGAQV
jgi:hypothetical protein